MLVLCIGISVPLAVYGAVFSEAAPTPDFELLSASDKAADDFDSDSLYAESASAELLTPMESQLGQPVSGSAVPSDTAEVTDELADGTDDSELLEDESSGGDEDVADEQLFSVTVSFYDREALVCSTGKTTLRELLAENGIWLSDCEHPSVELDSTLEYDSWISVDKTEYATVTESVAIPYSTDTISVTSIPRGTYQTVSAGQEGVRDTVYTVEYLNGVEVSRTEEYDYIASYPVNEVCYYGTGGTFTTADGSVYSYSYAVDVRASYYNIYGTTASGMPTGTNVVATDPSVFPLGTQMYIMNSSFDLGLRTAADTGGAVRGNFIDIWMDASCPYYEQFAAQGVWDVTVYVLD